MRANRSRRTKPEVIIASAFSSLGLSVVRNYTPLPGTPDVVVVAIKLAVFVHGCFWHGCPLHYRPPKTDAAYWKAKVATNRRRDKLARGAIERLGWRVVEIWEHEALASPLAAARRALSAARR